MRKRDENKLIALEQAALDLVQENGLSQLSINKLAKRAGVSVATAYIYFENKSDLLGHLYQSMQNTLIEQIEAPDASLPITQQFAQVMQAYAHNFDQNPKALNFMAALAANPEYLPEDLQTNTTLLGPAMLTVIKRAYQADQLVTHNVDLIVAQALQPLQWLYQVRAQHQVPVTAAELDQLIGMATRAIFKV
ncbi:AcrR family transcriptional regulator [Weissella uvarum]|uniref:TetR/AcrR family transcriptional regulator n=1 Tax=Weissella uvarum TaxID=1479233 RepID=UPI00195F3C3A|nr:TetR/AcrR family transcriptional regulator [Weissella uvarum]MBM7617039.1 AcrR family transcriptional regulator [Weissella uvarum]MCM0595337.1 TetR/AcrR family transcriptional regulator [Weissella uvarum]